MIVVWTMIWVYKLVELIYVLSSINDNYYVFGQLMSCVIGINYESKVWIIEL